MGKIKDLRLNKPKYKVGDILTYGDLYIERVVAVLDNQYQLEVLVKTGKSLSADPVGKNVILGFDFTHINYKPNYTYIPTQQFNKDLKELLDEPT